MTAWDFFCWCVATGVGVPIAGWGLATAISFVGHEIWLIKNR